MRSRFPGGNVGAFVPYSRGTTLTLLLCLCLCSGCLGQGSATKGGSTPAAVLGAPEKTINARWNVDPASAVCAPENLALTCHYMYRGAHVTVSFDRQHHAEQIIMDGHRHPSMNVWHFLNHLIPSRSHLRECRFVPHSSGGGTAHACLYQDSRPVIVAYFPHPTDPSFGGVVTYDYARYRDVLPDYAP